MKILRNGPDVPLIEVVESTVGTTIIPPHLLQMSNHTGMIVIKKGSTRWMSISDYNGINEYVYVCKQSRI